MEILLCQACGSILRGKSKYCTGCGTFVSRHSPTSLYPARPAGPMVVTATPDPLAVEKTLSKRAVEQFVAAHGGNGGNGGKTPSPGAEFTRERPAAPEAPPAVAPAPAPGPTSILGNVLKGVSRPGALFGRPAVAPSSLVSFDGAPPAAQPPQPELTSAQPPQPEPAAPGPAPYDAIAAIQAARAAQAAAGGAGIPPASPASPASDPSATSTGGAGVPPAFPGSPAYDPSATSTGGAGVPPAFPGSPAYDPSQAPPGGAGVPPAFPASPAYDPSATSTGGAGVPPAFAGAQSSPQAPAPLAAAASPETSSTPAFSFVPGRGPMFGGRPSASFLNRGGSFLGVPAGSPEPAAPPAEGSLPPPDPAAAPSAPSAGMPTVPIAPSFTPPAAAPGPDPAAAVPPAGTPPATDFFSPRSAGPLPGTVQPGSDPLSFDFFSMPVTNPFPPSVGPQAASSAPAAGTDQPQAPSAAPEQSFFDAAPQAQPVANLASAGSGDFFSQPASLAQAQAIAGAQADQDFASPAGLAPGGPESTATAGGSTPSGPGNDFFGGGPQPEAQASGSPYSPPATADGAASAFEAGGRPAVPLDDQGFPDESIFRGKGREAEREQAAGTGVSTAEKDSDRPSLRESTDKGKERPPAPAGPMGFLLSLFTDMDGQVDLLGKAWPKKQVLVALVVMGFIGFQIIAGIFGALTKAVSGSVSQIQRQGIMQSASNYPSLAGTWELAYQGAGETNPHPGQLVLQQQGNQLFGEGRDEAYFQLRGTFNPPQVLFSKMYVVDGKPAPNIKDIKWAGKVQFGQGQSPYMSGVFVAYIKKGIFYNAHFEEVRGRWEAQMTQPAPAAGGMMPTQPMPMPAPGSAGGQPAVEQPTSDTHSMSDLFTKIAIGFLIFGLILIVASFKLFGPAGMINIWAKKGYIPSQFRSHHNKMLKELGKPPRPGGLPLGAREDWNILKLGQPKELALPPDLRDQNPHMLLIGAGAKGKTRLIASMVAHDIVSADRAVVVIDSDGHLVDLILRWVGSHHKARELARRILVIDPTKKDGGAAFNPLEAPEDDDYQSAASSIVYGFKAIYTEPPGSQSQWNQQTANILRNAALLLMANNKTLTDLPRLLGDNDFRDELLERIEKRKNERVEFITLLDQWSQYKRLARTDQWINWVEPILNRVTPMLGDPRIRPILTSPRGDLSLRKIITDQKVLLVKIPHGQLDQNANLLGSLLITGLKQASLSIATSTTRRHFTALYLDEFDNFIEKETFDAITSETRKFQIGFVSAVKTLQHLPEDFRNQLIINVGTVCAFSLAKKDADLLGPQMFRVDGRKIKHQTITNFFNKVNTSPQFELISDEEKLNIDRLVGQEERTYFCYRVGTVAGVFHMKAHEFKDVPDRSVNWELVDGIYANKMDKEPAAAGAR